METLFDDCVQKNVELQIERGGKPLTLNLVVSFTMIICNLQYISINLLLFKQMVTFDV